MIDLRFRPLKKWTGPGPAGKIKDQFKTPWPRTLDNLERELKKLGAHDIIIEAGFTHGDLRSDGWPIAGRQPGHPGVILYFESIKGGLTFPCANYRDWKANIHAIALTLEDLRAIDRYGVTLKHQQYSGFAQIEAPAAERGMSIEEAAGLIVGIARKNTQESAALARLVISDPAILSVMYREAAAEVHPDNQESGDAARWERLAIAKGILDKHHEKEH